VVRGLPFEALNPIPRAVNMSREACEVDTNEWHEREIDSPIKPIGGIGRKMNRATDAPALRHAAVKSANRRGLYGSGTVTFYLSRTARNRGFSSVLETALLKNSKRLRHG